VTQEAEAATLTISTVVHLCVKKVRVSEINMYR
jgi:hypothetical protein